MEVWIAVPTLRIAEKIKRAHIFIYKTKPLLSAHSVHGSYDFPES